jgi:amino acid transporter
MATPHRHEDSSDVSPERKDRYDNNVIVGGPRDEDPESHHHLHRGLKARQITMIAIGGAIGTGLIIGT